MSGAPIVRAVIATAAGAALALLAELPETAAMFALLAGCAAAVVLLRSRSSRVLVLLFAALGCALGADDRTTTRGDCRHAIVDGAEVRVEGRFLTLPDSGARALLHAESLNGGGVRCADVTVRVDLDVPMRGSDTRVRIDGTWLKWPERGFVPAERAGMLRAHAVVSLRAPAERSVRERLRLDAQRRTRALYGPDAPLVEALLLARTETLPREVRARFADAGLVHLLAISGTHVALILGVLLVLAQALRLSGSTGRACALAGVVAYVLFLGAPAPAARAALQIGLLSLGRALQRPSDALSALAVSGLLLIVLDPSVVLDAGAQLSFAGVGGIIAFAPAIERLLQRLPRFLLRPLAAGIAASATTLPIAGLHFGTLAPIGILAGLPGIPLTGAAVPASALPILLSYLSESAARFLVPAAALALRALDQVATAAAAVPGGHGFATPGDVHALLVAAAAAILALRFTGGRLAQRAGASLRQSVSPVLLPGCAAAAASLLVLSVRAPLSLAFPAPHLELHAIDVGQGDAIAIRSPRGRWLLVDAGPRSLSWDAGAARIIPYLARRGVRELAGLIITHPDADHIGGAAAILAALDVHAVMEPAQPGARTMYVGTLEAARREGAHWIVARAGARVLLDGMTLDVLHPRTRVAPHEGANDYSVVLLIRFGTFRALLLGDAPVAAEEWIAARHGAAVRAQVLKVGHHGSATSTGNVLLRTVRPALAVITVGRRNRYGHPEARVLERLARSAVSVLRTDERGTIVVSADASGRFVAAGER